MQILFRCANIRIKIILIHQPRPPLEEPYHPTGFFILLLFYETVKSVTDSPAAALPPLVVLVIVVNHLKVLWYGVWWGISSAPSTAAAAR